MRSISPMPRANLSLPLNTSNLLGRTLGNSTVLVSALFYFDCRSNRDHPLRRLTQCLNSVMDTLVKQKNRRKCSRASASESMKSRSPSNPTAKLNSSCPNPMQTAPQCPRKLRPQSTVSLTSFKSSTRQSQRTSLCAREQTHCARREWCSI